MDHFFDFTLCVCGACRWARVGALRPGPAHDPVMEYLPLLGIFYALYADEGQAALAGFWCGVAYDVLSAGTMGIHTRAGAGLLRGGAGADVDFSRACG